jgi:hypothetical protein
MTKEEALELIRVVYHTYNQVLVRRDEPDIGRAWYPYLQDIEYEEAHKAFLTISMESEYMPKVMDIRRAAINTRTNVPPPPLPNLAWATFLTLIKNANNGMHNPIEIHECLRETIAGLGDAAYTMHNQYDQKRFEAVYEECVRQYNRKQYSF